MSATPREIVQQTLDFSGPPRVPRDLWVLPIAAERYPLELKALEREFPPDFAAIPGHEWQTAPTRGSPHVIGEFTDEWGCTFVNIQRGVIGGLWRPGTQGGLRLNGPVVDTWAGAAAPERPRRAH